MTQACSTQPKSQKCQTNVLYADQVIHIYTYIHTYIYTYIHLYHAYNRIQHVYLKQIIYEYTCRDRERERERQRDGVQESTWASLCSALLGPLTWARASMPMAAGHLKAIGKNGSIARAQEGINCKGDILMYVIVFYTLLYLST